MTNRTWDFYTLFDEKISVSANDFKTAKLYFFRIVLNQPKKRKPATKFDESIWIKNVVEVTHTTYVSAVQGFCAPISPIPTKPVYSPKNRLYEIR